jgi:GNAT superfamily N-acetyltransferase
MGEPAPERIPDEWIWAEYWTRYFTDREPDCCWVVERVGDGAVVGYLTGTVHAARVDRYAPFLLGGIVWRVVRRLLLRRPQSRRAMLAMLLSLLRGELLLPPGVMSCFPGTCHVDLLPEARGRGLGPRLMAAYLKRMRRLRVPGIHARTLSVNRRVAGLLRKLGFRLHSTAPLSAFGPVAGRPLRTCLWVRELGR